MSKIIKFSAMIVFAIYIGLVAMDILSKKPLRFEDFKTSQELQSYLEKEFPKGSNIDSIAALLNSAGAKCSVVSSQQNIPNDLKEYEFVTWCEYSTGLISLNFLENYKVILCGNTTHELVELWVSRHKGIY